MFVLRDTFQRVGLNFGFLQALLSLHCTEVGGGGKGEAGKRLIICFWKSEMLVSQLWLFADFQQSRGQLLLRLGDKQRLESCCAEDGCSLVGAAQQGAALQLSIVSK